ncbi:MAG: T9SS type A sorting domain-containing protein [Bacteroidota bacterium]
MRKLLFFWFLLGVYLHLSSQNLNIARHSYVDEASHLVSINSKYFYFEKLSANFTNDSANIVGINEKGKIIFKRKISFDMIPRKFIRTLDYGLLFLGQSFGCDQFGPNYILKLDTNGNKRFEISEVPFNNEWPAYIADLSQHADSSFYIAGDSSIYHFSKNWQFISKVSNGLTGTGPMVFSSNGNFIINGNDSLGVYKIIELNPAGSVLNQHNSEPFSSMVCHIPSGSIFGLKSGGIIEKINPSLVSVANTNSTGFMITSFVLKNDSIFFTGNIGNKPSYGILNLDLQPLHYTLTPYKKIYPTGITLDNKNRINILANATSAMNKPFMGSVERSFTAFYQFPVTGSFSSRLDIGISTVSLASIANTGNPGIKTIALKVKVNNYGVDTIRNFCLNTQAQQGFCNFMMFHKSYSAIIPPLSSVEVKTGTFSSSLLGSISDTSSYLFVKDVCLFTTVPNQESDMNIDNDAGCSRLLISDTIVERSIPESLFGIYPNPFDQTLNIRSASEIEEITMYNLLGQLIWQNPVNDKTYILHDFREAKGVYFLWVKTSEGTQIKKVVKE